MNKRVFIPFTLIAAMLLAICGQPVMAAAQPAVRLEDDFFAYINADFLKREIPQGETGIGARDDMANNAKASLIADFERMSKSGADNGYMQSAVQYYALNKDEQKRDAEGVEPVRPYIERIEGIKSLSDLQEMAAETMLKGLPLPYRVQIMVDDMDSSKRIIAVSPTGVLLGDVSFYDEDSAEGALLLSALEDALSEMLQVYGYAQTEAMAVAGDFMEFERLMVPYLFTAAQMQADLYGDNQVSPNALAAVGNTDFLAIIDELTGGQTPGRIRLFNAGFFQNYDSIVNEDNLPILKSWLICRTLYVAAGYLPEAVSAPMKGFASAMTGAAPTGADGKTSAEKEKEAQENTYLLMNQEYGPIVGYYYATTRLNDETRSRVTQMVEDIKAEHRARLLANDWLSKATIDMAVRKLDKMKVVVGYPDKAPSYVDLSKASPADTASAFACTLYIVAQKNKKDFESITSPVDKDDLAQIGMNLHEATAGYVPQHNTIVIFAGILQKPYFDPEATDNTNYGGIGVVIGHEITHAFDNNGGMYDENGNKKSWWTDGDLAVFNARIEAMAELFDGVPFAGGQVDGNLTVSENTADAGGISIALSVLKKRPGYDLAAFFESYARIHAAKKTQQMMEIDLRNDVHAPPYLRVNMQCSNSDEFYEAYDIAETDAMYLAPEERVSIW